MAGASALPSSSVVRRQSSNTDVGAIFVEVVGAALLPVVELAGVDDELPFGVELDLGAIHRARRGAFEVDALAVVTAAVARALELILARLPVGRAAQVRAARVDDEEALAVTHHPDAVLLLPLRVHPERVVAGEADAEDARRLEDGARQEEARHRGADCEEDARE